MSSLFNLITFRECIKSEIDACKVFQQYNVIPKNKICKNNHCMHLKCKNNTNYMFWKCNKKICRYEISVRKDTWLEGSRLPLRDILLFIYCWCKEKTSVKFCKEELNISARSAVDYNNFIREVSLFIYFFILSQVW